MERLTTLDASFLYLEKPDSPMHVAGVLVLVLQPHMSGLSCGVVAAAGSALVSAAPV